MGRFNEIKLTSKGLRLLSKVQTGETLVLKSVVVGTGYLTENIDVTALTELVSPVTDAQVNIIGNEVTGDGYSQLEARIEGGEKAFYLREIGIIATDPDEGDILYAYTNAGDYADFIPASSDNVTTQDITLITIIGNAENVTANITLDAEVRREEFTTAIDTINKRTVHSEKPVEVGTWVDGNPIWRVSFPYIRMVNGERNCTVNEENKSISVNIEALLLNYIADTDNTVVINQSITGYTEYPTWSITPDEISGGKIYFARANEERYEDYITYGNGYWGGYIEFATSASNILNA